MTKIIGIKELQTNTKKIREDVEKGTSFVVVWRSKPVFEIKPLEKLEFAGAMKTTGLYTDKFIKRMEEAEEAVRKGNIKTYDTLEDFLASLS